MNIYTKEELQKRAWIADSIQVDLMVQYISASYQGDVDTARCLLNKVIKVHWLSELMKRSRSIKGDFNSDDFNSDDFN
jgi:hypothetical protein